jgi:hypothetical protein
MLIHIYFTKEFVQFRKHTGIVPDLCVLYNQILSLFIIASYRFGSKDSKKFLKNYLMIDYLREGQFRDQKCLGPLKKAI